MDEALGERKFLSDEEVHRVILEDCAKKEFFSEEFWYFVRIGELVINE